MTKLPSGARPTRVAIGEVLDDDLFPPAVRARQLKHRTATTPAATQHCAVQVTGGIEDQRGVRADTIGFTIELTEYCLRHGPGRISR